MLVVVVMVVAGMRHTPKVATMVTMAVTTTVVVAITVITMAITTAAGIIEVMAVIITVTMTVEEDADGFEESQKGQLAQGCAKKERRHKTNVYAVFYFVLVTFSQARGILSR